jgi:exodeoxyribonuclease VII large subunit
MRSAPPSTEPDPPGLPGLERRVLTPSQLNAEAQVALEEHFGIVRVEGELSNFARPASGHWYFTLKDRRAQVRCAMFRSRNQRVRFRPEDGLRVLVRGRVSLYVSRGEFQLVADAIEPAGEGALRLAFEQLRARLAEEGLFEDARKRPLPPCPRHLALVTSPTGAAIRDLLSVLGRRWPVARVTLLPASVQGEQAVPDLTAALARLARWRAADPGAAPEVVVLGRGGGSLEDLWAFNEEAVARAVAACPVPVISAVGHETDYTITDFVADLRAPTPSAAAELATPAAGDWWRTFEERARRLAGAARRGVDADARAVALLRRRLRHPGGLLRERSQRVDELELRLRRQLAGRRARGAERLAGLQRRLRNASPGARLRRDAERLAALRRRLHRGDPRRTATAAAQRVAELSRRLERAWEGGRDRRRRRLDAAGTALQLQSPLGVVDRGYALLTRPPEPGARFGELVRDPATVSTGERLHARLAGGVLAVTVEGTVAEPDGAGKGPA